MPETTPPSEGAEKRDRGLSEAEATAAAAGRATAPGHESLTRETTAARETAAARESAGTTRDPVGTQPHESTLNPNPNPNPKPRTKPNLAPDARQDDASTAADATTTGLGASAGAATEGRTREGRTETPLETPAPASAPTSAPAPAPGTRSLGHEAGGADAPLVPHDEWDKFSVRLQQAVGGFVDEPRAAVEEADHVLEEVAARFADAITQRRRTLRASWQPGGEAKATAADTEQLRLTLRDYRELTERLMHS
ncbi:hypothetical protein ACFV6E_22140 [Streptomyces sp. NPDC059785]|uniref:hypothetical protein n=1 Tax=unclassified Streptomyces TaxID=2593676 RepID=UPI00365C972E